MKKFIVYLITSSVLLFSSLQTTYAVEKKAWVYVVANGDSLWNITSKFLTKIDYYTQLQQLNNIKHPKRIQPGSVIRIPMEWIKHTPASARISFIQGESLLLRDNKLIPLTASTTLVLGDEIRTSDKSSVTVVFADGSEMVLFKNTIIAFDHLSSYGKTGMVDTRVSVIQGKVETNAKKNKGPGSRLDISTPSAISSVRGTMYRVSNTQKNISTVEVIEGTVAVAGEKSNNSIKVATGQGTRIEKGTEPTKPVPLLAPPHILTTQTFFEQAPVIKWDSIEKAKRYNIQVSPKKDFKRIIWGQITTDTFIVLPKLNDDMYYYRVTAIDALGIEGKPAYKNFTLNLSPRAPQLKNIPERILGNSTLSMLSWENSVDLTDRYKVEVAKDEKFTQLVLNKNITGNQLALPNNLAFGNYYWRVSSIVDTDKGPASTPLMFNWTTTIETPQCNAVASSGIVDISWKTIKNDHTIIVETAQNDQFTQGLKAYQISSEKNNIQHTTNDELFVRCKITASYNNSTIESPWSKTQHTTQIDKGVMSLFGFILLIILI
ncbi:FecR domain-containing protein [Colwellia sp. UCD-KL20]|uniref:FecR domain-containing protein n=1 Tax=Colwellia sp. UCD-KL20 TaxID=1917165 RepID=UPI00097038EA|nr:FecR domain-containing protein [Colwellia sp. UCD-KL20]